jgi:hypothetical protein
MLKYLLCVDFYIEDDSKKFPIEFIDSKIKLISSIFENFKKDKFSLGLISSNQKNGPFNFYKSQSNRKFLVYILLKAGQTKTEVTEKTIGI